MILQNGKRIDGCSDTVPVGTLQPYLGLVPPKGYLVCQGQLVSKTTYSKLYEICGDTFGTSTETHFYLPDLRGKTLAGYDENDTAMNTIGKLLGQKTHVHTTGNHTLTVDEMPIHKHNFQSISGSNGGDLGDYTLEYLLEEGDAYPGHPGVATSGDWGSYGTLWITETGGSQPHNHGDTGSNTNYQPTITVNWIVKAVMLIPDYIIVEDTLNSDSTVDALSARQGKLLNEKFVDYATKSEMIQYLPLSGGSLSGVLTLSKNLYMTQDLYGMDAQNSDIIGLNALYWADRCDSQSEGIHFYREEVNGVAKYDTLCGYRGEVHWIPNNDTDTSVTKPEYILLGTHNTDDYVVEQGTVSGWKYRKWKSGITETWYTLVKNTAVTLPEGSLFWADCGITIPSGLFSSAPVATASVGTAGGRGAYLAFGNFGKTFIEGWIFTDIKIETAQDFYVNLYMIGQYN